MVAALALAAAPCTLSQAQTRWGAGALTGPLQLNVREAPPKAETRMVGAPRPKRVVRSAKARHRSTGATDRGASAEGLRRTNEGTGGPGARSAQIDPTPIGAIAAEAVDTSAALAKSYCAALAPVVNEARAKAQAARLRELESALQKRVNELSARIEDLRSLLSAREEAQRKAEENVLAIYSKMKPESAATQLSAMDEHGAAAILAKLNPRASSLILSEITPEKAARLMSSMAARKPATPAGKGPS